MATKSETTFSAVEAAAEVGVSYRMLDYWIRTGIITITGEAHGSGSRRVLTAGEVAQLQRVLERVRRAQMVLEAWSSGALWVAEGEGGVTEPGALLEGSTGS